MLVKHKFKWLTSLMTIPCLVGFSLSTIGCSKKQNKGISIVDPENKKVEGDLDSENKTEVWFVGFSYENIEDENKLGVSGTFSSGQAVFEYSISGFDIFSKTFSVQVAISNASVTSIKGKFSFTYDKQPIAQKEQSEFEINILPGKKIILPDQTEGESQIEGGHAEIKFSNFTSENIDDTSQLIVEFSGQPTFGSVSCTASKKLPDDSFIVTVTFDDVLAETVVGMFEFWYGTTKIEVEQKPFTCKLTHDPDMPDFKDDSWEDVCYIATDGLEALQKHYGVANFVGLKRNIMVDDSYGYPVIVIGQNHDHYESGNPVALTFQFDNVISIQTETGYDPDKQLWSNDSNIEWWYDPEKPKDPDDLTECSLRKYLREEVTKRIEASGFFKPVIKKTISGEEEKDEGKIINSKDTIWCASLSEVGFVGSDVFDEGECYEYYQDCPGDGPSELRVAKDIVGGEPQYWWLRTPHQCCMQDGDSQNGGGRALTIRPCFCI